MTQIASVLLTALTVLIALSGHAFAGPVAEPGTLALLAAGLGALVAMKYFARKWFGVMPPTG